MTDQLIIALAQIDPTVGNLDGNATLIRDARSKAAEDDADIVVFLRVGNLRLSTGGPCPQVLFPEKS